MHFLWKSISRVFFTFDKHQLSGVTLCIAFRRPIDDFVIVSDDAAKHYNVKTVEANLYVRKMMMRFLYFE